MTAPARSTRLRGGPLVMLAVLLTGWSAARAVWWENPFPPLATVRAFTTTPGMMPPLTLEPPLAAVAARVGSSAALVPPPSLTSLGWSARAGRAAGRDPRLATAHHVLWGAAMRGLPARSVAGAESGGETLSGAGALSPASPFGPAPARPAAASSASARWSVDAWAFWRQGSDAAPVSQGRVPIYGASQAGAVLQYRLAPGTARDPRLYARAYRALVRSGESEAAIGASARPVAGVPLRAAGELRFTDAAFSNTFRPAAYVVTEFAPLALPYGARLEAYGQAGWVGGPDPTGFADGQASVTGEMRGLAGLTDNAVRVSFGAAAWGGAQKDAQRIDIGPTLRLDLTIGAVPARLSVDWRERVGGDAGPDSGLAATLSTQF